MGRNIIEILIICHLIWVVWLYGNPNIFDEVKNKFAPRSCFLKGVQFGFIRILKTEYFE